MAAPFPGMDPFLEADSWWAPYHQQLLQALGDALSPAVGDRYKLRFGTRSYLLEQILFTSILREEQKETFLEIRQKNNDRLVTLLEVVCPANRTNTVGRNKYLLRRGEALQLGAHLVEAEFVLQGQTVLEADLSALADRQYIVSVYRHGKPGRHELYGTTLQKRLPRVRIPLAPDDRDVVLDFQASHLRAYDKVAAGQIDYTKDPPARLSDADAQWLDRTLKAVGLRK